MHKRWIHWLSVLRRISLVDRCLMLFMLILLLQSGFSLFLAPPAPSGTSAIDVMIRTSSAAIFGYFLSGSFGKTPTGADPLPNGSLQTAAISVIGILALLFLLAVRYFFPSDEISSAATSQLRDFVSAGVGFLVSRGTGRDPD